MRFGDCIIRFEATFQKKKPVVREYETYDGLLINVYTLDAVNLIREKVNAYISRRKIRDLYDIFFLLRYVDPKDVKQSLLKLIKNFKKPVDEQTLKSLIIVGITPTLNQMLDYIKSKVKVKK